MDERSPILAKAEIMPEVVRYHLWGVAIMMTVTVVGIVLLPIALPLANHLLKRYYERLEIVLTRRDLKVRRGILNVEEKSIPLEKITDLAVYQGPLMRLFDLKGIRVETAGQSAQGALVSVVGIADVDTFRDTVLNQRDRISDWQESEDESSGSKSASARTAGTTDALLGEIRDSLVRIEQHLAQRN
ncbi:MAG: PH domain-containing protein [Wenzhouxiangella sp.]